MNSVAPFSFGPLFEVLAISLCVLAAVLLSRTNLKAAKGAKEAQVNLLKRLEENPTQVKRIALSANEPLQVTVHLIDGKSYQLIGVYGAEAIILYEKLMKMAPEAETVILENGREVKN